MRNIISLIPDARTAEALKNYARSQVRRHLQENIQKYLNNPEQTPQARERFHSTIYHSEEVPLFKRELIVKRLNSVFPLTITPSAYSLQVFGSNVLVLAYQDNRVSELNAYLVEMASKQSLQPTEAFNKEERKLLDIFNKQHPTQIYSDFNPHISLARNCQEDMLEDLVIFGQPIIFSGFTWKFKN